MLEKTVENHLRKRVKECGGLCFKWSSPSHRGVPDDIVFIYGEIWFVEVKKPGGRTTKLQDLVMSQIREYTDNVCVLSSKEEINQWLEARQQICLPL